MTNRTLQPGDRFGQYKILRLLGRGGMGEVYAVEHTVLGKTYALKLLNSDLVDSPEARRRLETEARVMADLEHPNIVAVDEYGETDGCHWLRMELVGTRGQASGDRSQKEGGTAYLRSSDADGEEDAAASLGDYLASQGGKLPEAEVRELLRQILEGLAYAHGKGVVHRDLKPANILLKDTGYAIRGTSDSSRISDPEPRIAPKALIADFGLVRLVGEEWFRSQVERSVARSMSLGAEKTVASDSQGGISTGAFLGTFAYMSPEQKRGEEADERSDLYAVGLMAYQMLTGEESLGMRRPSELAPGIDPAWDEWILSATEVEASQRPSSAAEMLESLPAATGERRASAADAGSGKGRHAKTPPKRKSGLGMAVLLLLFLAGLGYAGWHWGVPWWEELNEQKPSTEETAPFSPAEDEGLAGASSPRTSSQADAGPPEADPAAADLPKPTPPSAPSLAGGQVPEEAAAPAFTITVRPESADARLWLGPYSDHRIEGGETRLKDLLEGRHRVRVDAAGYQPFNGYARVGEDGSGELTVDLVPILGRLRVEADPGTTVVAVSAAGRETRLGTTDEDGVLVAEDLLNIGTYDLRLSKENHESRTLRGVDLRLGRREEVSADLVPLPGKLHVFSVPRGAAIFVDGEERGTTPATLEEIAAEEEKVVEVRRSGYRSERKTLTLGAAESREVDFGELVAESGGVLLKRKAEGGRMKGFSWEEAEVRIDGREVRSQADGSEDLALNGLEVGEKAVEVSHPDYEKWAGSATIRDGEVARVEVDLEPLPGELLVEVSPGAAVGKATLWANDREIGPIRSARMRAELPAGKNLVLEVRAKRYLSAERRLMLPADGKETWKVDLEESPSPQAGSDWTVELPGGESMELVWLDSGRFTMGSPEGERGLQILGFEFGVPQGGEDGRESDEGPRTEVVLSEGFWLGKTEVTLGDYREYLRATGDGDGLNWSDDDCPLDQSGYGLSGNKFGKGWDQPVVEVSWEAAMRFCRWLTERERKEGRLPADYEYTLPTEAQWEYACRAPSTGSGQARTSSRFSFGDSESELGNYAWYSGNSGGKTHTVGGKRPNAWGLYDMHGNVWEWTRSRYEDYPGGTVRDYEGPSSGSVRVTRGGGWLHDAQYCRSANRSNFTPGRSFNDLGFRVALAPNSASR